MLQNISLDRCDFILVGFIIGTIDFTLSTVGFTISGRRRINVYFHEK